MANHELKIDTNFRLLAESETPSSTYLDIISMIGNNDVPVCRIIFQTHEYSDYESVRDDFPTLIYFNTKYYDDDSLVMKILC